MDRQVASLLAMTTLASDPAEMGVAEAGRIFEAVAERPVDADMGDPDQRERQDRRPSGEKAEERERQCKRVSMRDVVGARADPGPEKIAEHGEVRRQKQNRKQRP